MCYITKGKEASLQFATKINKQYFVYKQSQAIKQGERIDCLDAFVKFIKNLAV